MALGNKKRDTHDVHIGHELCILGDITQGPSVRPQPRQVGDGGRYDFVGSYNGSSGKSHRT